MYIEQTLMNAAMNRDTAAPAAANNTSDSTFTTSTAGQTVSAGMGSLPGGCTASLAFPYVPMQERNCRRYNDGDALQQGTVFPALNMQFRYEGPTGNLDATPLNELMAMDFVIDDLGLYLTTHCDDQEAFDLYQSYIRTAMEKRGQFEAANGPLTQTALTDSGCKWLQDPWPWEKGGNR